MPPIDVYYLEETKEHKVIINYPDGSADECRMVLKPSRQELYPISQTKAEYKAISGTASSLEAISKDLVLPIGGSNVGSGNTSLEYYNPDRYKLTQADGTIISTYRYTPGPAGNWLRAEEDNGRFEQGFNRIPYKKLICLLNKKNGGEIVYLIPIFFYKIKPGYSLFS
ncbi:MAG: hypothetical protein GX175_07925 [Halanaerobiaceae bacterium]|nr:hypothetical protein [Halanaerobiaceae bacterium]